MFDRRVWVEKPVPLPCRLSISKAYPNLGRGAVRADQLPLWLRAGTSSGVHLDDVIDAELLTWARLASGGQWVARVRIRPLVGTEIGSMTLWVTADAVEPWPG